jgi:hypothetical protein
MQSSAFGAYLLSYMSVYPRLKDDNSNIFNSHICRLDDTSSSLFLTC